MDIFQEENIDCNFLVRAYLRIVILKGTVFLDLEADNLEHILDVLLGRTWFTMAADS